MNNETYILEASLLGLAVGDSIGLATEGMSKSAIKRLGWTRDLQQRFVLGRGMVSDDTEHGMMTLERVYTLTELGKKNLKGS